MARVNISVQDAVKLHQAVGGEDLSGKVQPGAPQNVSIDMDDATAQAFQDAIKKGLISSSAIAIGDDG